MTAPAVHPGWSLEELLRMPREQLDAIDADNEHPYSYNELSELYALTPRASLSHADRVRADEIIAGANEPNPDTPWVRGELLPYNELLRLFDFEDRPVPETPPGFELVSSTPSAPATREDADALSDDEAARIFDAALADPGSQLKLGAAHRRLWEKAHPGESYTPTARKPSSAATTSANARAAGMQLYTIEELASSPNLCKPREPVASHVAYLDALVLLYGRV